MNHPNTVYWPRATLDAVKCSPRNLASQNPAAGTSHQDTCYMIFAEKPDYRTAV